MRDYGDAILLGFGLVALAIIFSAVLTVGTGVAIYRLTASRLAGVGVAALMLAAAYAAVWWQP